MNRVTTITIDEIRNAMSHVRAIDKVYIKDVDEVLGLCLEFIEEARRAHVRLRSKGQREKNRAIIDKAKEMGIVV
jgi:hypothetical protein